MSKPTFGRYVKMIKALIERNYQYKVLQVAKTQKLSKNQNFINRLNQLQ